MNIIANNKFNSLKPQNNQEKNIDNFPKVLIIGQPFNNNSGGGITLINLFTGWNPEKLAVICSAHLLENTIDTTICQTYYQIGEEEQKWMFPFNLFSKKYASKDFAINENVGINSKLNKTNIRVNFIMKYFLPFLNYTGLINIFRKTTLSNDLCNWLNKYNPDIIYAQSNDRERIKFILQIYNYLKKPMIFHMMDDWPALINKQGIIRKYWGNKTEKELKYLFKNSSVLMSICEEMTKEYENRYNKIFIPFHNPVEIDKWLPFQHKSYELGDTIKILYAGRIGLGIDKSLKLIAKAIENINKELNLSIHFVLQTETMPNWSKSFDFVIHQKFVEYTEIPNTFSKADILLLPYDFSKKSIKYIKFSMPTKASEFMISGTPIFVFAPSETAVVKYAKHFEWAKIVTENNIQKVTSGLKELLQNIDTRKQIATNAKEIAIKTHNAIGIRNKFQNILLSLSQNDIPNNKI